jgi:cardiolipin synthase
VNSPAPFGRGRLRRLFGLDRTAPAPKETRAGEALHPLTIPNMVGYARLAGLPVFLYLAFDSGDGRTASAAILFWLIAAGDYLDGFLARVTGQYSRMGALLDPIIDRLTILSGGIVCWHFELLPRWALAVLVVREVATLALAQFGLRHGVDLEINWVGRVAVFPVMASIFFAMVFDGWVPSAMLIFGLVLAVLATALYARIGWRALQHSRSDAQPPAHSP